MFEGGFRRDGFERVLRRVGGTTGVFWEACVGVASYRISRIAVINLWRSAAACCSAAVLRDGLAAAARRLAAVKATVANYSTASTDFWQPNGVVCIQ